MVHDAKNTIPFLMRAAGRNTALLLALLVFVLLSSQMAELQKSTTPVFTLLVTLTFTTEEALETFKTAFQPLADYVRENEPGTRSYEVSPFIY